MDDGDSVGARLGLKVLLKVLLFLSRSLFSMTARKLTGVVVPLADIASVQGE